ncbi:hypothetical protein F3Y22_tig00113725pilonHSYRG00965 [Hibiscus syriacus]|uniref:MULE transposase domain-containing protein n=1 Tax=Hibiscus syriacus TaxID=106335 RepID=A0A6A2Y1F5_HIBSY|nr:hypothetical protein F3Y22_tig00113725pilonHSYRG00965 [Hibiscus syriacus]
MSNNFFTIVHYNGQIMENEVGVAFQSEKPINMMFKKDITFIEMKHKIERKIRAAVDGLRYRFMICPNPVRYAAVPLEEDDDIGTMVGLHESTNIAVIELFVDVCNICDVPGSSRGVAQNPSEMALYSQFEEPTYRFPNSFMALLESVNEVGGTSATAEYETRNISKLVVNIDAENRWGEIHDDSSEDEETEEPVLGDDENIFGGGAIDEVPAPYEATPHMYEIDYDAMRAPEFPDMPHLPPYQMTESFDNSGEFSVGVQFRGKNEATLAIKEYCIKCHVDVHVAESNQKTLYAKCVKYGPECKWKIRVSKNQRHDVWVITRYNGSHTCLRNSIEQDHRLLDSDVICEYVKAMVEKDPRISCSVLAASIRSQFGYQVKYGKVWNAKMKAMKLTYGDWDTSYNELPHLLQAMKRFIPGTIVKSQTMPAYDEEGQLLPGKKIFHRLFWAFKACIDGFPFCKRMIQVDGTWLYGQYRHVLLMAVAQDGERNIFPIAFAIVEGETTEAWDFFLTNLRQYVVREDGVCLISDRGTGILEAIERPGSRWIPPYAYPTFCDAGATYKVAGTTWRPTRSPGLHGDLQGRPDCMATSPLAGSFAWRPLHWLARLHGDLTSYNTAWRPLHWLVARIWLVWLVCHSYVSRMSPGLHGVLQDRLDCMASYEITVCAIASHINHTIKVEQMGVSPSQAKGKEENHVFPEESTSQESHEIGSECFLTQLSENKNQRRRTKTQNESSELATGASEYVAKGASLSENAITDSLGLSPQDSSKYIRTNKLPCLQRGSAETTVRFESRNICKELCEDSSKRNHGKGLQSPSEDANKVIQTGKCFLSDPSGDPSIEQLGLHSVVERHKTTSENSGQSNDEKTSKVMNKKYMLRSLNMVNRAVILVMPVLQSLILAYSADGWKGLSHEKLKPEKELQRATSEIHRCKSKIRDQIQQIGSLCDEGRLPESLFNSEGQIDSEGLLQMMRVVYVLDATAKLIVSNCLMNLREQVFPSPKNGRWRKSGPNFGLASDDSDENDYNPDGSETSEKDEEDDSEEFNFTCTTSEEMEAPANGSEDDNVADQDGSNSEDLDVVSVDDDSMSEYGGKESLNELLSIMESASEQDGDVLSKKRSNERLDYKRRRMEMFLLVPSSSSDDEDWTITRKRLKCSPEEANGNASEGVATTSGSIGKRSSSSAHTRLGEAVKQVDTVRYMTILELGSANGSSMLVGTSTIHHLLMKLHPKKVSENDIDTQAPNETLDGGDIQDKSKLSNGGIQNLDEAKLSHDL